MSLFVPGGARVFANALEDSLRLDGPDQVLQVLFHRPRILRITNHTVLLAKLCNLADPLIDEQRLRSPPLAHKVPVDLLVRVN